MNIHPYLVADVDIEPGEVLLSVLARMRNYLAHQLEVDGTCGLLVEIRGLGVGERAVGLVDAQVALLPVAAHVHLAGAFLLQPALQGLRLPLLHNWLGSGGCGGPFLVVVAAGRLEGRGEAEGSPGGRVALTLSKEESRKGRRRTG